MSKETTVPSVIPAHLLEDAAKTITNGALEMVRDLAFRTPLLARKFLDIAEDEEEPFSKRISAYRAIQSDRLSIVDIVAKYGGKNPFLAILEDELRSNASDIVVNFKAYCEAGMPSAAELSQYRSWLAEKNRADHGSSSPCEFDG